MRRAQAWFVVALLLGVFVLSSYLDEGLPLRSDITALLPVSDRDPLVAAAADRVASMGERSLRIYVLAEPSRQGEAARAVADALRAAPAFTRVARSAQDFLEPDARGRVRDLLLQHRFRMLSDADRQRLRRDGTAADDYFLRRAKSALYGFTTGSGVAFLDDPFGLVAARLASAAQPASAGALARDDQGHFVAHAADSETTYPLILAQTREGPFALRAQASQKEALARTRAALHRVAPSAEMLVDGLLPHAAAASAQARNEVTVIGGGALVTILLLMGWAFGSLRPFLLSMLVIGGGVLLAVAVTAQVFGSLHLLTLVFGASLVGVAVDYCMHFFASRAERGVDVQPAILLGLLSSVAAYASMVMAPFPGVRQMAFFAAVGLVGTWLGVRWLLPATTGMVVLRERARRAAGWWIAHSGGRLDAVQRRRTVIVLLASLPLLALLIACNLKPRDDIRLLHSMPAELQTQQARIAALRGGSATSAMAVLVRAPDRASLWDRERRLLQSLDGHPGVLALSAVFPPPAQQQADYALLGRTLYRDNGPLEALSRQTAMPQAGMAAHRADYEAAREHRLRLEEWLDSPLATALRSLWLGEVDGEFASVVLLRDAGLRSAAMRASAGIAGAQVFDQVERLSSAMGRYRHYIAWLLVLAYGVAGTLLALTLGWWSASLILLPPLVATAGVLVFWSVSGFVFSVFSLMGLVLLLGIGADYGIFLRKSRGDQRPAMAAVMLSMSTTMLAFGLLALSQTPALRSFGLSVGLGVPLTFLLASVLAGQRSDESN